MKLFIFFDSHNDQDTVSDIFDSTNSSTDLGSVYCWSPSFPDTDPVKKLEPEGEKRLAVKDRRKGRKERRSTGIVQPEGEVRNNLTSSLTWPTFHCQANCSCIFVGTSFKGTNTFFLLSLQQYLHTESWWKGSRTTSSLTGCYLMFNEPTSKSFLMRQLEVTKKKVFVSCKMFVKLKCTDAVRKHDHKLVSPTELPELHTHAAQPNFVLELTELYWTSIKPQKLSRV